MMLVIYSGITTISWFPDCVRKVAGRRNGLPLFTGILPVQSPILLLEKETHQSPHALVLRETVIIEITEEKE